MVMRRFGGSVLRHAHTLLDHPIYDPIRLQICCQWRHIVAFCSFWWGSLIYFAFMIVIGDAEKSGCFGYGLRSLTILEGSVGGREED